MATSDSCKVAAQPRASHGTAAPPCGKPGCLGPVPEASAAASCKAGGWRPAARPWLQALVLLLGLVLAGCATTPPAPDTVASPPREALPLDVAVLTLADALLLRAEPPPGTPEGPRPLMIDPLIDRATGTETATTRAMSRRIAARVEERHPGYVLRPFTLASLESRPLVLLGAITGVITGGSLANSTTTPGAYRIWAVLADLRSGTVVAHETAWVRPDEVDPAPTAFHRDSPGWLPDPAAAAYLRVCAGNPGDPIDPIWRQALRAEVLLADATAAYEAGRYGTALNLYSAAAAEPAGGQLRTYNGLYLSNAALDRRGEAEQAFAALVDYGLARKQLAVKFLFRPGSTDFWPDPAISGAYPMWLRQIARRTAADDACLDIAGHASPSGDVAANEQLSLARAQQVRGRLVAVVAALEPRTTAEGVGARRPLIGTGADDVTDLLDRRVEFQPRDCGAAS